MESNKSGGLETAILLSLRSDHLSCNDSPVDGGSLFDRGNLLGSDNLFNGRKRFLLIPFLDEGEATVIK